MSKTPRSILLIRLKGIGEVVMSLGVLEALSRQWPEARIDFLAEPPHEQLLEDDQRIHRLIRFDKRHYRQLPLLRRPGALAAFLSVLRTESYDLVVDLHGVPRSQWLARAARGKERYGRESGHFSDRFFRGLVDFHQPGRHNVEMLNDIARICGADHAGAAGPVQLQIHPRRREHVEQWLREKQLAAGPLIGLHPGAVSRQPWPVDSYIQLGIELALKHRAGLVITAGEEERTTAEKMTQQIRKAGGKAETAVFSHLLDLSALIQKCRVYVAGDTGPMHIGVAVNTPLVSVFRDGSDPARSGPVGQGHFVFYEHRHHPPVDSPTRCPGQHYQGQLGPEAVLHRVEAALQ
jgi:ADP-heptose:LPS heptosyltransferase